MTKKELIQEMKDLGLKFDEKRFMKKYKWDLESIIKSTKENLARQGKERY